MGNCDVMFEITLILVLLGGIIFILQLKGGIGMKRKIMALSSIILILLSGCSSKNNIIGISSVKYNDKIITIYEDKESIESILGESTEEGIGSSLYYDSTLILYGNNETRTDKAVCISVKSRDFTTYNGIKVGDSKSSVINIYDFELETSLDCIVCFDGDTEVNIADIDDTRNDYIMISYKFDDDDKVSQIMVGDREAFVYFR